jgi:DNA-binding GntR family transcriptional regulator
VGEAADVEGGLVRLERPRSLTALVVDQIRDLIVTGKLKLGEQLSENTLAERLGVSRTPVREAFLRLEAERLVEIRPQRGTFVFHCDATDVRDICELRGILEAGALRLGMQRDRDRLLEGLERNLRVSEAATLATAADYQPFDHEFHEIIVAASGNRQLIEAYGRIAGRVRALRYRLIRTLHQVEGSKAAHREVVESVRANAADDAEVALRHHVYTSYRALVALFESGGSLDTDLR